MSRRRWRSRGAVPVPRRVLLGLVAVVLGVAAHAGAGGAVALDPSTLVAALLAGAAAAAGAGRGPLSPARCVALLGTGQLALHTALGGASTRAAAMPGMDMSPTGSGSADAVMLGAHAAVVLVVAALLSGADRAVTRLVAAWRRSVAGAVAAVVDLARTAPPAPAPASPRSAPEPAGVGTGVLVVRTHRRRGPPAPPLAPVTPGGRAAGPGPHDGTDTMTPSRRRAPARLLLPALLAGLLALVLTPTAGAHDAFVGSDPAAGATLPTMPSRVTLTFAEAPQDGLATITVVGADGRHVERGTVAVDDGRLSVGTDPAAPAGRYEIGYRVVSDDGHPVSGAIPFTTTGTAAPATSPAAASPAAAVPSPAAASSPADSTDSGGVPGWLIAVVAAVVVIGAVGFVARRRT